MTSIDQLFALLARQQEVIKRVKNGGLDVAAALAGTQGILDGEYPIFRAPSWYVHPVVQLERVVKFLELHGGESGFRPEDIPASNHESFVPVTKTEVQLLTVMLPDRDGVSGLQRTFDAWWDCVVPPDGLRKWRLDDLKSDSKHLRLIPGIRYRPGIRWVGFDPYTHQGRSPEAVAASPKVDGTTLAHTEVLMAAAQFPGWISSLGGRTSPRPSLSGLQFKLGAYWSHTPDLGKWDRYPRLELGVRWAGIDDNSCSSPVVRKC